jgi:Tfp pilus assembly protein PilF
VLRTGPPTAPALSNWLCLAVLIGTALAAYWPVGSAGFIWDDKYWLEWNPVLQAHQAPWGYWTSGKMADYVPLTSTLFWLQDRFWGHTTAANYHWVNLALHIAAAAALWRVLRRLAVPGAFLAALVFAVHPVTVASAAWIAEQKNTLSLLLMMGCLWAYLRFDECGRHGWYAAALAFFALALLAKASVVVAPAVLLGCLWWRRHLLSWRQAAMTVPFWLLAVIGARLSMKTQLENFMDPNVDGPANLAERLVLAGRAIWFYLGKAFWPTDLVMVYPRWNVHLITAGGIVALAAVLALILALAALCWHRRVRPLMLGLGCYFIALLPTLGLVNMGFMMHSFVADHWQYLALPAVIALVVGIGWSQLARRGWVVRAAGMAVAAAVVVVLAVLTNAQARTYQDIDSLWRHNLTVNPACIAAHVDLAVSEIGAHRYSQALWHYQQILPLRPKWAELYDRIGRVNCQLNDYAAAASAFATAAELAPDKPEPHYWQGWALIQLDRMAEAQAPLESAIRLRPDWPEAQFHLGLVLSALGHKPAAAEHFRRAMELRPSDPLPARHLALLGTPASAPASEPAAQSGGQDQSRKTESK